MTQRYRCRAETVPRARRRVEAELRRHHLQSEIVDRLVLATAEACNNAIIHSDCTRYAVTVDVAAGLCTITVTDSGQGFDVPQQFQMPEPYEVSRRGLALIGALVDEVEVTSTAAGTTVVLRQPLAVGVEQAAATA